MLESDIMSFILLKNRYYTLKEVAEILGVTPQTIGGKIDKLNEGTDYVRLNRPAYLFPVDAIPKLKMLRGGVSRNRRKNKKEDV